ncbi:hypothetical protein ID855_20290 [Xenorhabdus sp. ZM]|uniref:hypothetical protein n=1 Tax=Xenorhabdus szentirmaii TaxID=290112 RepID=UPI00199ECD03|nr:hypothetical protein [Xenorhabdus sp. ZM]MBD2806962.1 hypothetical protein [Xenorhabdus sp. ZM]
MEHQDIIFKVDKKYMPFLLKAINAAREFAESINIDITNHHISFEKFIHSKTNEELYEINFCAIDSISDENLDWMAISVDDFKWIRVEMDPKTTEIIMVNCG